MDYSSTITDCTQTFLQQLGVAAEIGVEFNKDDEVYLVNLNCEDPAILIGHHGETLSSLQLILGQHLKSQTGEWLNLSVNVNDYRERREKALQAMVDSVATQVVATGKPHTLPAMPANERRVVHLYLAEHPQVATASVGEGRSRSVIISPK